MSQTACASAPSPMARNSSRKVNRHDGSRPTTGTPLATNGSSACSRRRASLLAFMTWPVARKVRPQHSAGAPSVGQATATRWPAASSTRRAACNSLRFEVVGEGVGENHHRGVLVVDIGGGEEGVAAPLRQRALLGEAEIRLHEPGEIEQPGQPPRPRRDLAADCRSGGRAGGGPCSCGAPTSPRSSCAPCRRRSGSRACSPCRSRRDPSPRPRRRTSAPRAKLAGQREPQRIGAAARQVHLVARRAEGRAHRAGVELRGNGRCCCTSRRPWRSRRSNRRRCPARSAPRSAGRSGHPRPTSRARAYSRSSCSPA